MAKRRKGLAVNSKPRRLQTGAQVGSVHSTTGRLLPSANKNPAADQFFSTAGEAGIAAVASSPSTSTPVVGIPGYGQGKVKRRGSD